MRQALPSDGLAKINSFLLRSNHYSFGKGGCFFCFLSCLMSRTYVSAANTAQTTVPMAPITFHIFSISLPDTFLHKQHLPNCKEARTKYVH